MVTYVYLMKERSELYAIFKLFYQQIKTQFDTPIRIFHCNNTGEFSSSLHYCVVQRTIVWCNIVA